MSKIFFVGDSITTGAWDPKGGWAARVIGDIMAMNIACGFKGFYCLPYNLGVSGDQIPNVLARLEGEIAARIENDDTSTKEIVVSIGVNDSIYLRNGNRMSYSESAFDNNVKKLMALCHNLSNHVTFLGILPVIEDKVNPMPWAPDKSYENKRIEQFENIIGGNCAAFDMPFMPLFQIWQQRRDLPALLIDGVHPSEKGHALLARQVADFLLTDNFITRHS